MYDIKVIKTRFMDEITRNKESLTEKIRAQKNGISWEEKMREMQSEMREQQKANARLEKKQEKMELLVDQLRLNERKNQQKLGGFERQVEQLEWLVLQLMN